MASTNTSNTENGGRNEPPHKSKLVQRLAGFVALTAVFASVFVASTTGPSAADWREECIGEGCSSGERAELFEDFQNECVDEGCWAEEVGEIAGVGLASNGAFIDEAVVTAMMDNFQARSSYDVYDIEVRPGKTYTIWPGVWQEIRWIIERLTA